jgi:hypothetical protein
MRIPVLTHHAGNKRTLMFLVASFFQKIGRDRKSALVVFKTVKEPNQIFNCWLEVQANKSNKELSICTAVPILQREERGVKKKAVRSTDDRRSLISLHGLWPETPATIGLMSR